MHTHTHTHSILQLMLSTYSRETQIFSNNIFSAVWKDSGAIEVDVSVQVRSLVFMR